MFLLTSINLCIRYEIEIKLSFHMIKSGSQHYFLNTSSFSSEFGIFYQIIHFLKYIWLYFYTYQSSPKLSLMVNIHKGHLFLTENLFGKKTDRNSPLMNGGKDESVGQSIIPLFDTARIHVCKNIVQVVVANDWPQAIFRVLYSKDWPIKARNDKIKRLGKYITRFRSWKLFRIY